VIGPEYNLVRHYLGGYKKLSCRRQTAKLSRVLSNGGISNDFE